MFKYSKDGVTVFTILDKRRMKAGGKYPVKIQVCYLRMQKYYTTGKDLSPEEWERLPATKLRSLLETREDIENSFNIVRDTVRDIVSTGDFSFDALNMRLKGAVKGTVNTAIAAQIDELQKANRFSVHAITRHALKYIEDYGGKNIPFAAVTVKWLQGLEQYMRDNGLNTTTIAMYLRSLKKAINDAQQAGVIKPSQYPFGRGKYEIQEGEGRKLALTLAQIGQIAHYKCHTPAEEKYRDYWLFLYYCNGINVADFIKLKYKNIDNGEICFVRQKTAARTKKQKEIRAIIIEPMQRIIDRYGNPYDPENYIFPILPKDERDLKRIYAHKKSFIAVINRYIHRIGQELGLGNISTYTARHSFATVLKRSGANIAYISESLGHSSLGMTENYLASFEREEREKNAALLTRF